MEVVKDVAAALGLVLSIISLLTFCTKTGRDIVRSLIQKNTKDLHEENKKQTEAITQIQNSINNMTLELTGLKAISKQQCRNNIKNIYYHYYDSKKIPLYERKTADATYEIYKKYFDGNSYATLLYSEICKWEVITTVADRITEE